MAPAEISAELEVLVDLLAGLSEHDAVTVLGLVGGGSLPDGWETAPNRVKRAVIRKVLEGEADDRLMHLWEIVFGDERGLIEDLVKFFLSVSEGEADKVLRLVGSSRITPSGWEAESEFVKSVTIRQLLISLSSDELTLLAEYLPSGERADTAHKSTPDPVPAVDQMRAPKQGALVPVRSEVVQVLDGPIFVVHGHDRTVLHEAVRVLERGTGREVVVLHEQVNAGRTILEKFEDHAANASYAVVLLTGDDEGGARTSANRHLRGRQNVIFELGFFFGKLGRRRVAVLLGEDVEKPSDIDGLVYINLDQAGAWKQVLARELEAVGIQVNYSRIP